MLKGAALGLVGSVTLCGLVAARGLVDDALMDALDLKLLRVSTGAIWLVVDLLGYGQLAPKANLLVVVNWGWLPNLALEICLTRALN